MSYWSDLNREDREAERLFERGQKEIRQALRGRLFPGRGYVVERMKKEYSRYGKKGCVK